MIDVNTQVILKERIYPHLKVLFNREAKQRGYKNWSEWLRKDETEAPYEWLSNTQNLLLGNPTI